jgi:hypothetical protein
MASDSRRFALALGAAVGLLGALSARVAHAAPPAEADFRVTYYLTDEQGKKSRIMSLLDMTTVVNQARCECGQDIIARIARAPTPAPDIVQIQAMVGQQCALAQQMPGISQYDLCAQLVAGLPAVFQNGPEFPFDPIWLAYGTEGTQSIDTAVPNGECNSLTGQGGIWMCIGPTDCMMGNFFMQGTSNINIPMGETPQGISFDFVSPLTAPTNFRANPGDSAVEIAWDATSIGDISGYRILCADEDGNPIETGYQFDPPSATDRLYGQIYYTRDNLCPGGLFGEEYDPEANGWGDTGTDDGTDTGTDTGTDDTGTDDTGTDTGTDDSGTDTGTDDSGTDTECTPGSEGCACNMDLTCDEGLLCTDDICSQGCTAGAFGCPCDNGACDPGYECSASNFCMLPTTGIQSLDWRYVCSPHISGISKSARVEGLENGKSYQFLVVAYDYPGNPLSSGEIITATPIQTNGLWEQCETQGDICGEPGFCTVAAPARGAGWLFGGLAFIGLSAWGFGVRRRRDA